VAARHQRCRACGQIRAAADFWKGRTYCKECCRPEAVAARKAAAARKKRTSHVSRASRILRTYGLTPADEAAILAQQGGVCPICLRRPKDIDHCHKTGEVRGKLCGTCNRRLLTAARNDPELLRRAAAYLENPPARQAGPFFVPTTA
jgi:recombination endonuclease VII